MIAKSEIYTKYFDGNGQYNAWNWTPWHKQEIAVQGSGVKSRIETTSDTSRLTMVGTRGDDKFSRTLQYQSNPGRGYISYMRWDEDPGFSEGYQNIEDEWVEYPQGYEHEVYLNNYDYSGADVDYNQGQLYLQNSNTSNIPAVAPNACIPTNIYYASSLPGAYIDTRLDENLECDSRPNYEISFTIGSEFGYEIEKDQYYFTYIETGKGDLNKPIYKVQGSLTSLNYDFLATGGYTGTWAAFGISNKKLIYDSNGLSNVWVHSYDDNRDSSYPFWYRENN
jgi:hypothetical protein